MKILYLLRYYPTVSETFVYREIEGVVRAGHEVVIAALGTRPDGRLQTELPDVPVLHVPRRTFSWGRATAGQRWLAAHQRPKDVARLPWLCKRARGFDRVHVHFAGEAAEIARALREDVGIPYTVMVHGSDLFQPRPSLRETLAAADAVLAIADHHVEALAAYGIASRRVRCGPDLERLHPQPAPARPSAVAVGRNVEKKGFADLLRAWPAIDLDLTLVSDWSEPVPPRVTVTGLLPSNDALRRIAAASVLVLPCRRASTGDMDGVPVVLMEALALGRPVVTTRLSGIPELVDERVGWIVPPDDPDALVAALREACDPVECARRGVHGPARLRERGFTLRDQVGGVLAAWGC